MMTILTKQTVLENDLLENNLAKKKKHLAEALGASIIIISNQRVEVDKLPGTVHYTVRPPLQFKVNFQNQVLSTSLDVASISA